MSQPIKVKGLVIRQVNYGEYDKMLTVLTDGMGRISVSAKGVRSMKSKNRAASELLCFNEFVLNPGKNEVYSLSQCECIESFFHLRDDCIRLACGVYMADLAGRLSPENMEGSLKLLLNSLFMLQDENKNVLAIKLIYELKLLYASGFTPEVSSCVNCGGTDAPFYFNALAGGVICKKCGAHLGLKLMEERTRTLIKYITEMPLSRALYETDIDEATLESAGKATEEFMAMHISENIKTLDYLKKLVNMQ